MSKKKDPESHFRTERAMRAALRGLAQHYGVTVRADEANNGTPGKPRRKSYELEVWTGDPTINGTKLMAIFDLRRCVNDRPGLKGIKKIIGPRRKA